MSQADSSYIDAFERYRQSRPGPSSKLFHPNIILLILLLIAVGIWTEAGPSVVGGRVFGMSIKKTARFPDGLLTVVQLDVGQGDGTFIHTPGGYNVLIDCGEGDHPENEHSSQYPATKYVVRPFLEAHQIYDIDMIVLTHPDSDHGGGLADLIDWIYERGGSVGKVVDCGVGKAARFYQDFLAAVERHQNIKFYTIIEPKTGEPAVYPELGGTLIGKDLLGDPTISYQFLGPLKRTGSASGDQSNNNSIASRIQCGDYVFLMAGDAEGEEEELLVTYWGDRLKATVCFPPHHGSKTSDEPNWLRMVNPEIMSTSSHPPVYGHPAADAVASWKRYINPKPKYLLHTYLNGDIWYRTDGHKLAIRTQFDVKSDEEQWKPGSRGEWSNYRRFEPNDPTIWSECIPVPGTDNFE